MNDITIAQEKAREAIDLLKEAVLTIVRHETETAMVSAEQVLEIGLKLEKSIILPLKTDGTMGQAIFSILLLLQEDELIERSPLDNKKWILSKK